MSVYVRLALMFCVVVLFWAALGCVLGLLTRALGFGLIIGLLIGVVYAALTSLAAPRFALDSYDAERLNSDAAPRLYEMVQELSKKAGTERPSIYLIPDKRFKDPNAFAVAGRDRMPIIAITHGLTEALDREEVRAVLALMVARLAQPEAGLWMTGSALAGLPLHGARSAGLNDTLGDRLEIDPAAGMTAFGKIALTLLNPPCAALLRIIFRPGAVNEADDRAANLTGNPSALASALMKIHEGLPKGGWGVSGYNPATALLFAVPPLPPAEKMKSAPFWLRSQCQFSYGWPDVTERAKRLQAIPQTGSASAPTQVPV